jgi:rod shape-determining protein MreD
MSIPFAAVGAVLAALIETSVITQLAIAGVKLDLVFVLTIVAAMVIGVEDGLTWAFLGGLMLDMLVPDRRIGMTPLILLILAGVAFAIGRFTPGHRVAVAGVAVFLLSLVYQVLVIEVLAVTTGTTAHLSFGPIMLTALVDLAIGLAAAALAHLVWRRFGPQEQIEW